MDEVRQKFGNAAVMRGFCSDAILASRCRCFRTDPRFAQDIPVDTPRRLLGFLAACEGRPWVF